MLLVLKEFLFLDPGRKAGYSRGQCDFGSNVQVVMNTNMDVALVTLGFDFSVLPTLQRCLRSFLFFLPTQEKSKCATPPHFFPFFYFVIFTAI